MDIEAVWTEMQRELSEASRNDYRLRTLSSEKRALLGLAEYRRQSRVARRRLKLADQACLKLRRMRAEPMSGETASPP